MTSEIIIIGAGAAGLSAANELAKAGVTSVVLEARDRIGGRIFTLHDEEANAPIELGAEFIHGKPFETFNLAHQAGLKIIETSGESWHLNAYGKLEPAESDLPRTEKIIWQKLGTFIEDSNEDISVQSFLDNLSKEFTEKENFAIARQLFENYVAGFHAAELEKIGVKSLIKTESAEEEIEGERAFHLPTGYNCLSDYLFEQAKNSGTVFQLKTTVKKIKWRKGHVEITAENDEQNEEIYTARAIIVTLPLGVLKASTRLKGAVRFEPQLISKKDALQKIEMGAARRIVFTFKRKWWADILSKINKDKSQLGFLFTQNEVISVWWTNESNESAETATLTGWTGGDKAVTLSQHNNNFAIDQAIESLCKIFQIKRSFIKNEIISVHTFDWQNDCFARGSYSYIGVDGTDAPRKLAESIEDTLFFAGEATNYEGYWGTVHGALATGMRAAQEVLAYENPK